MDRKKELKEQYKQMKTEMGVLIVQNKINKKYLMVASQNLKGMINRIRFQLSSGGHPNIELQKEWKEFGEDNFEFNILETLEYSKDETKTDYTEELQILEVMVKEKLTEKNTAY